MPYVEWTPDMGEISGFGGGYEAACRAMVKAGVEYWEMRDTSGESPKFDPHYKGFKGVFGLCIDDNVDAKALDEAMMNTTMIGPDGVAVRVGDGATGAMHQAAVNHIFGFRKLGAAEYVSTLRRREVEEAMEVASNKNLAASVKRGQNG